MSASESASNPDHSDIDAEEAFRLLQHRHTVTFLQLEQRRIPLRPNTDGDGESRGRGEFVGTHEENDPEPRCKCGGEFESVTEAREHLNRVAAVLDGAVDWGEMPLRFDDKADPIEVELGETIDFRSHYDRVVLESNIDSFEVRLRNTVVVPSESTRVNSSSNPNSTRTSNRQ